MSRFRSIAPAVGMVSRAGGLYRPVPDAIARRIRRRHRRRPPASAAAPSEPAPPRLRRRPRRRRCTTDGKFKGANVNILTFNGPQVAEPLQRRAPDWECLTGGHVNVVAVGFQTIYDKALLDASTGTNAFDAYVFNPQWLGDFVGPGLPRRPDRSREQRSPARLAGHRPVLPGLQRDLQRQGLHDPARRRLPHGLLPQGHPRQGRRRAAGDVGRLPHDRGEIQRPGPQRGRRAGLRVVHRQEEGASSPSGGSSRSPPVCSRARARTKARSSTPRT